MAEIRDRTYSGGEQVDLDDNIFTNCRFESASFRYGGGPHPTFVDCTFGDTGWYFGDAALRTIQLLQQLGGSPDGSAFIADLFKPGNYITE